MVLMTSRTFLDLVDVADDVGATLHADYSGRGMYGSTCLALACNGVSELVRFVLNLAEAVASWPEAQAKELGDVVDELHAGGTAYDQLGTGMIYYWPLVQVER